MSPAAERTASVVRLSRGFRNGGPFGVFYARPGALPSRACLAQDIFRIDVTGSAGLSVFLIVIGHHLPSKVELHTRP
jgi:hypothetical protein